LRRIIYGICVLPGTKGVDCGNSTYSYPRWRRIELSKNTFSLLSGAIFLVVGVAHALRLVFKWEVVVAGWQVPMWVSPVAFVIAAYLAYEGFRMRKSY
jgi:hypothetical protein